MHPKLADSIYDVGPSYWLSASLQNAISEHFDEYLHTRHIFADGRHSNEPSTS